MRGLQNVGRTDRIVRTVLGVVLAVLAAIVPGWPAVVLGIAALLALVTGLSGVCPVYKAVGMRTDGEVGTGASGRKATLR
jgi:hypothetical protein